MKPWNDCKNILITRPDNMGDLIMSGPAIRAIKESFSPRIIVLTSTMAAGIAPYMPEIDEVIIFDTPWVKSSTQSRPEHIQETVDILREQNFDAAIIFTVYSQNPLPSAMMAYMAGIPKVLAYCRENPYCLITDWVPDKEPYSFIRHQVARDLELVKSVGAKTGNETLQLNVAQDNWSGIKTKLANYGINPDKPWLVLHAGVSEPKREYPFDNWVEIAKKLISEKGYQVLFTGSNNERLLTKGLSEATGTGSFSIAGLFNIGEFICLLKHAPVVVSVNTGTIHIAAAVGTPVVVLYAQSNPQHTPWKVPCRVLPYSIPHDKRSKNEVIGYVNDTLYKDFVPVPRADEVIAAIDQLINRVPLPSQPFHDIQQQKQAFPAS